jgi:dsRNA-specific ribonuclease
VMYKSQLQEYAQKAGLMHPTYDHVKEGASHEPRFKSTVWVNNQSYESAPGFPTLRSAEHAAAKVALDFLQKSQTSGVVPSPVVSSLFYS